MAKHIENIVIGKPIAEEYLMFAYDKDDWENVEKDKTFYTEERFLPNILLEIGIVPSKAEIRRNKPELLITLDKVDFIEVKWGKKKVFILVGE